MTRRQRVARTVQAFGALAVLAILVVGIPWALVHYIGGPFPHHISGWHQIRDTLTQQGIPDDFLLKLLAIVVWIAWTLLVASLIAESIGMLRGKTARALPLTSPLQPIARWLVTAVAVGIITTTTGPAATTPPALAASLTALRADPNPVAYVADTAKTPVAAPAASKATAASVVAPQPESYVVQRGDTLWDIAGQHLGDSNRWPEIYDLNHGQPQPDGTTLTDPNLIYPGWTFELPASTPPIVRPTPPPESAPPAPTSAPAPALEREPAPAPAAPSVPPPPTVTSSGSNATAPPAVPTTMPAPQNAQHEQRHVAASSEETHSSPLPYGIAGTALLATGSLGLLALLRRRQMQRRQAGHAIPKLSDELAATEIALRAAANETAGLWLDLALRAFASQLHPRPGDAAPQPVAVQLTHEALVITLGEPSTRAPKPWSTSPPGWRWHLPLSTPTHELERLAADACAPMPALITIGTSPDGPVMLDLEACGLIAITGTLDEARGLARSAALELAVSPVADELDVVLVGDSPLLPTTRALRQLTHVRTIREAIALVVGRAAATGQALDAAALTTTFAARCANRGTDPWAPTLLIVDAAADEGEREQLEELGGAGGRGIGILAIGDWHNAPWNLAITDGQIDAPRLGIHGLTATIDTQHVEQQAADATVQLFEQADNDTDELLLQSAGVDPDACVEEHGPSCVIVPITVRTVGAVRVDGATRPLTATETELVTYLATREHPVDADIIQTALWPDRTVSAKRWWNLISETRKALGVDDDGNFHLPPLTKGQPLQLGDGVTTDLACIETAFRCVRRNGSAKATSALVVALADVSGRPFDTSRGYAWVHANGLASYAEALIVDATHELAALYLDRGEMENATTIIATGLRASPGNEILYRDLMRAHDQAGDTRGVDNAMRDLLVALEANDPYSDLQPETVDLYERLCGRAVPRVLCGARLQD